MWEYHPEITNKSSKEVNKRQLEIKHEQFTEEELDAVPKNAEKLLASTKYIFKYGRQGNLTTYFNYTTINKT